MLEESARHYQVGLFRTSDNETHYLYTKDDGNGAIYMDDTCTGAIYEFTEVAIPIGISNVITEDILSGMLSQNVDKGVCGYIPLEDGSFMVFYYDKARNSYSYAIGGAADVIFGTKLDSKPIEIDNEVDYDYD